MAFGQAAGPPATDKQVTRITDLLLLAGYTSLREARHPYGLTQRQAGGKFTRDEAAELVERLEAAAEVRGDDPDTPAAPASAGAAPRSAAPRAASPRTPATRAAVPRAAPVPAVDALDASLRKLPDDRLVRELTRRGWTCTPPG